VTDVATDTDALVRVLAECKQTRLEYAPLLDSIKEREDAAKDALLDMMIESGGERIRKYGVVVSKATRETPGISDLHAAMDWLEARNLLGNYVTVDAKRVAANHPECPGIFINETPYLSVREDQKK
jgi:hypothetical protein